MKTSMVITIIVCLTFLISGGIAYNINKNKLSREAAIQTKRRIAAEASEKAAAKAALEEFDKAFFELSGKITAGQLKTEKDFSSLQKDIDVFKKKYKARKISETVKGFKKSIIDIKFRRIAEILLDLTQQAESLSRQKKYADAANVYSTYTSDFHKETLSERTKLHDSLLLKAKAQKSEVEKLALAEKKKKEKNGKALFQQIAAAVIEQSPENAYKILQDSPYRKNLKTETQSLKNMLSINDIIIKSFNRDIGKTVSIKFKKGGSRKFKIIKIKSDVIIVENNSRKIKIQKKISPEMLSLKEKIKRLAENDKESAAMFYGLAMLKKKQYRKAETAFRKTGSFAEILSAKAAGLADKEEKEQAAKLAAKKKMQQKKSRPKVKNLKLWSKNVPRRKREFYVSPTGKPRGRGSKKSPWDIASALSGEQSIPPGSVIWVQGGTYKAPWDGKESHYCNDGWRAKLSGAEGKPIHIRGMPGERVILDGGLVVTGSDLWIWDMEITVSQPKPTQALPEAQMSKLIGRPWGGLNVNNGDRHKFINLIVHGGNSGGRWNLNSHDGEMHGCIFYDNSVRGKRRSHGDSMYTQNKGNKPKIFSNCIMTQPPWGRYTFKVIAHSENYRLENIHCLNNTVYNSKGCLGYSVALEYCKFNGNNFYNTWIRMGAKGAAYPTWPTKSHHDIEVKGNTFFRGRGIQYFNCKDVTEENNLIVATTAGENTTNKIPNKSTVKLIPNLYDPTRAHVVCFNWRGKKKTLRCDVGDFMNDGEHYELRHPKRFYDEPLFEGVCKNGTIKVPVLDEFNTNREFAVYVLVVTGRK